jgi:hypothetical protein
MRIERLEQQVNERNELTKFQTENGVSSAEVKEALGIVAQFKRNPADAVRDVVARALAQGYTLDQLIGQEHIGAVNTAAIKQMMEQQRAQAQQEPPEVRQQREVRERYDKFISEHEHSEVHANAIGDLAMKRGITPEAAYYKLREFAYMNMLDFAQPLGPQIAAKRDQTQQPSTQVQQRPAAKPMMSGNGAATAPVTDRTDKQTYSADDDWKSILRNELAAIRSR